MDFEGDAFISYAHLDNIELVKGHDGWVANLHRALETRVSQLLGKPSQIWWDPKLQGNDYFAETLTDRLRRVALLVSVVSPRYVRSEWGRRELSEFFKAAEQQGGVRVHDKSRVFKVLKTPVSLDLHPPELQSMLGYEFFKIDPETGRVRELNEVFGPQAQQEFWLKLDDLAHDVCALLEMLGEIEARAGGSARPESPILFLAVTTADLKDQRDIIKRDLEQHGYTVLPAQALPLTAAELTAALRADLARCRMSIHMIGKNYSLVPEGDTASLLEIQNELAIERACDGRFSRLIWMPPGLRTDDERQRKVLESLRHDPRIEQGADLIEAPLEDLRTAIDAWLARDKAPANQHAVSGPGANIPQLYLLYDQPDADAVSPWADYLFNTCEVIQPKFEGDEAEVREYHEDNLRECDGVVILYGATNEVWLRRKLRELQKSAGYGRTKPAPDVTIVLIAPKTPEKERFRTHQATVICQWDGFSAEVLRPVVDRLKEGDEGREGDVAGRAV